MRYLHEAIAACLAGVVLAAPVAADDKDRFKDARKWQKEQQKRYEEQRKRYEERDREERKRYEEQLREDAKRQREFDRDQRKRYEERGGFGGYFGPAYQPGYQYPDQGPGQQYAPPAVPYGAVGHPGGLPSYPQVQPANPYPSEGPSLYGQPSYGPPLVRSYGFSGTLSAFPGRAYGFSGQFQVIPLHPQPAVPTIPPAYYPDR